MMQSALKIHAIILALNEEQFIKAQLDTIYPFCSKISVITQYDRDWYGTPVQPDNTVQIVLNYKDPAGKINLVTRRMPDEAAARNMEMLSFNKKSFTGTKSHGRAMSDIAAFHSAPDYFWIIDADELYDVDTIPDILMHLELKKPTGMRVTGYNYLRTWNQRVPRSVIDFTHFGFIKPGILFEQRRVISWNESRIKYLLQKLHLPDFSSKLFGFINCPEEIGVFHHACWLGDNKRIRNKFDKSSHRESLTYKEASVDEIENIFIPTKDLPKNIQNASWPVDFFCDTKGTNGEVILEG
ncbi:MAG: hypothetical protein J0I41_20710 [Filimonas sp.]|nr:hypothetical protein [Filimonas sp.]